MRKTVLFHLIILLFACNPSSGNKTGSDASKENGLEPKTEEQPFEEEEIIFDIKEKFEEINQNAASYETKLKEVMGESTEGGELKSYYQNEELKKVVTSYFGEMGKSIEEYYFSGNKAFFVFTQQYSYDKPISVAGSKVKGVDENRYYFHNDRLVRWLDPNKEQVSNSNFKQKESELLQKLKELKGELGSSEIGHDDDYIDMKSLFSLSPLSIFDDTTEGLSLSEKNDLLKKGESASWEIVDESKTKLAIRCKYPSSEITLHFLKNKDNLDGLLFAEIVNGDNNSIQSWKYSDESRTLQKTSIPKKYNANDFLSKEDELPDSYEPVLYYKFVDEQTIEVSLHTWMEKEFENREVINEIFLKWDGEGFEEEIERIKK